VRWKVQESVVGQEVAVCQPQFSKVLKIREQVSDRVTRYLVAAVEVNLKQLGAVGSKRENGVIGNLNAVVEFKLQNVSFARTPSMKSRGPHPPQHPAILRQRYQRGIRDLPTTGEIQSLQPRAVFRHCLHRPVSDARHLRQIQRLKTRVALQDVLERRIRQLRAIRQGESLEPGALSQRLERSVVNELRDEVQVEPSDQLRVCEERVLGEQGGDHLLVLLELAQVRPLPQHLDTAVGPLLRNQHAVAQIDRRRQLAEYGHQQFGRQTMHGTQGLRRFLGLTGGHRHVTEAGEFANRGLRIEIDHHDVLVVIEHALRAAA